EQFQPDVILSDHALPQFNSLEALKICRKRAVNVPFILVTGTVSEEFAVSCLKQGADDYVLKSNMVRLPSAIHNALRQRHHEVKRKKAERTLRKQNEELIKINKELDSFVYSVSHNLRAPLMSVLGLINLVQLENKNADQSLHDYFEMMQQSIHKLDDTLKEILDYSRNARSALTISEVDVRKMVLESFDKMKYMEGSEDIVKSVKIEEDVAFYTDPYRLSVIINNLVSNAIKYRDIHKKDHELVVEAMFSDTDLILNFRDNGIGISPEYLPRIFEMFFRATERSEGAGLGLYIVKETVDKLHGTITVDSVMGEGTTFKVVVPNLKILSEDQPMDIEL
ncbi:MAG TPA: hybrid sensor histidine kinase/response regulator, partial [Chryseosolibacter sp.]|nr:hybrid sensor histidine kinase/response regulator [Chryseosolibacter sp.]